MRKWWALLLVCVLLAGCGETRDTQAEEPETAADTPLPEKADSGEEETPRADDEKVSAYMELAFSDIQLYDGTVYATQRFADVPEWTQMPVEVGAFLISDDMLYYLKSEDMLDMEEEGAIYCSALDGTGEELLAAPVSPSVMPRLVENYLFYTSNGGLGERPDEAGLYCLDMGSGETELVHAGMYYTIFGADTRFVYYRAYEEAAGQFSLVLYRLEPETGRREQLDIETVGNFAFDGRFYMISGTGDTLMRVDPDAPEDSRYYSFALDESGDFAVIDGWIYYSDAEQIARTSVDGEKTEHLAERDEDAYWIMDFRVVGDQLCFYEMTATDEEGKNTRFCRVPLEGGEKETLFTLYMN